MYKLRNWPDEKLFMKLRFRSSLPESCLQVRLVFGVILWCGGVGGGGWIMVVGVCRPAAVAKVAKVRGTSE